jgi:hypothetical protein
MRAIFSVLAALSAALLVNQAHAQTASATGNSGTTCSQNGTTLTCTTTTTLTLPSGTNLNGMSLPQSIANGPVCTGLAANPSVLQSGVATLIALQVNGCPTSSTYIYSWGAPVAAVNASSTTYTATLTANTPTQNFSVQVCFANNPSACSTYTASIGVQAAVPSLSGCSINPATNSVVTGSTPVLTASCSTGTGAGSGVTYQWLRNGNTISGATASSYTLSPTADTAVAANNSYTVQINNSAPSSASASATVTVTTPPAGSTDYCPSTPVRLTINASEPYRKVYTSDYVGTFSAGNDFVVQFEVGANDTTLGRFLATLGFVDFGATRGGRYVTFSKNKCDYTNDAQWVSPNFFGIKTAVNAGTASVAVGSDSRSADVRLTPGRWYLNIQNVIGACPSNVSCHAAVEWAN